MTASSKTTQARTNGTTSQSPAGGEDEDEVLVVGVPIDGHPRIERLEEPVPLTFRHGEDHFRAVDGGDLEDGRGVAAAADPVRRNAAIDAKDPPIPVEPDEMEGE